MSTRNTPTGYCSRSSSSSSWQDSPRRLPRPERALHSSSRRCGDLSSGRSPRRRPRQSNGHQEHEPFHYNDTLPPNAVGSSRRPEQMSDGDEYHSSTVAPLESNYRHFNNRRKMELRVRIEGAKGLIPHSRVMQTPPSAFVTVQTTYGRGKTPIIYNNANPPFNDEFIFEVSNPDREEITGHCGCCDELRTQKTRSVCVGGGKPHAGNGATSVGGAGTLPGHGTSI
ncbi:hypothetical protein TraAM80_00010 [Trypanosoma rangeli]|uniref:C2 domain-containing protein n=1 Tax=Trypanosoma rangeli TaxID=5698 RepID=A0A3S5ISR1_TRYRA|nr:uncharacterized protein TraAM80_00010 [Trypanosoma rangeli]RNF12854.1 hypothetical protein TraAM80_00010 [Trypanosoma rangeli]|eukprot:RNF12854.1 hypothetical protein TraAM80_00010 [Trypanosoma rangeli]